VPQIEVTFDIDANGIVNVGAKDLGTGKEQSMVITGGSALPKDDIDKMMREAEQYAEEDHKRREETETRNNADTLAYSTEKFLGENDEKIPAEVKTEVQAALDEVKKALEGTDVDAIRSSSEKLAQVSQKMGAAMYAQNQPGAEGQAAGAQDGAAAEEDEVVDAEIVDDEKDKRQGGAA
jgi:molecular chaperone DnaK